MKKIVMLLSLLFLSTHASADLMPEARSMRVRFAGETPVTLIRYSSYCTLNSELYAFYGGERDVISMPADTKASMLQGLDNQGTCTFPNGMYLINGQGYRFFQRSYACKALPGEVEYQEKLWRGSYKPVSPNALQERLLTGDCSYDPAVTYCRKMYAQKSITAGLESCVSISGNVDLWMKNPETGETFNLHMNAADTKKYEETAKSVEDINDEIYRLEWQRAGCNAMYDRNLCASFIALALVPDRWAKAFGAFGTLACYWVTGGCVKTIDVELDDAKYEKQKLRDEQKEREKEAKAKGTVASPSQATAAASGGGPGPIGPQPNFPDPFPPTYSGEVIISEAPPGPMPGGGGTRPTGGSHK